MTEPRRPHRAFISELKCQSVALYQNGKRRSDIIKEYDIVASLLDKWLEQSQKNRLFQGKGQSFLRRAGAHRTAQT